MQSNIHPQYYPDAKVTCSCGNTFTTGSTVAEIQVDICSQCHPFFTGEMRFVDTQGRVEKFEAKRQRASNLAPKKKRKSEESDTSSNAQTLKEMMQQIADQTGPAAKPTGTPPPAKA